MDAMRRSFFARDRGSELGAVADAEFAIGAAEVRFDRLGAEDQLDRKHKRSLHACRNSVAGRSRRAIRP